MPSVYARHCLHCQKQSASAFGMSLFVERDRVHVEGPVRSFERGTDGGARTRGFFCPDCGSRVYHASSLSPDRVTIKAGSLDDMSRLRPVAHIWVARKQPWVMLDPAVPAHATQTDNFAKWRRALAGGSE